MRATESALTTVKLAASALASMNPHYHPYGAAELTSPPHPPSPDNNNYHGHPGAGGPPPNHSRMMATNGHGIGPLGKSSFLLLYCIG